MIIRVSESYIKQRLDGTFHEWDRTTAAFNPVEKPKNWHPDYSSISQAQIDFSSRSGRRGYQTRLARAEALA